LAARREFLVTASTAATAQSATASLPGAIHRIFHEIRP
jgi:hypothetical protein